jgi:hypothetical protein
MLATSDALSAPGKSLAHDAYQPHELANTLR